MKNGFARALGLGALALGFLLAPGAFASPHITDFNLDLTREELSLRRVTECGDRLCGAVDLGGITWNGVFTLTGDKVSAIALSGPASEEYMQAAIEGFAASPYVIEAALTDTGSFVSSRAAWAEDELASFLRRAGEEGCSFLSLRYGERAGSGGGPADAGAVSCSLSLDASGITIIIMKAGELARELDTRMAAAPTRSPRQVAAGE